MLVQEGDWLMPTIFYALVSDQGTACGETGLCEHCFDDDNQASIIACTSEDVDIEQGFIEVTGNEAIECNACGRIPEDDDA